jgi:DNA-binding HxlR family transcriptional regulator
MGRLNSRKKHKIKPVNKLINYSVNILHILSNGESKSENKIFEDLIKLNEGLNYKRDAIDTIHILKKNHMIEISKSNNHLQRYEVKLAPLGSELISFRKNMEQYIKQYKDQKSSIEEKFVCEVNIPRHRLKSKLLAKGWKIEQIPYHDKELEEDIVELLNTLVQTISALSISYIKLLSKVKENEAAKAISNGIFTSILELDLPLPTMIVNQDGFISKIIKQDGLDITYSLPSYQERVNV